MRDAPDLLDLLVVGAGPAGIALGAEAVEAGIEPAKILILEKAEAHSFTIRKFYPDQKLVTANYKGFEAVCTGVLCIPDLSKGETLSYLDRAIASHWLDVRYRKAVHTIRKREGHFLVETEEEVFRAKTCAIAIGILGRPRKPDWAIPRGLAKHVTFDVTSVSLAGKDVLVVGGGDSASEYVQYLVQEKNRVALSYRGAEFHRMNDINRDSLESLETEGRVVVLRSTNVSRIEPFEGRVRTHFEGSEETLLVDHVVCALGGTTPENFLKTVGIEFEGPAPVLMGGYETSVPGLFLVGDLTAGKAGGSIISAFNSANDAMRVLCESHLACPRPPGPRPR